MASLTLRWIEQEVRKLLSWKQRIGGYIDGVRRDLLAQIDVLSRAYDELVDGLDTTIDELKEEIGGVVELYLDSFWEYVSEAVDRIEMRIAELQDFEEDVDKLIEQKIEGAHDTVIDWVSDAMDRLIENYLESEVKE
jgi:hypothetical protein